MHTSDTQSRLSSPTRRAGLVGYVAKFPLFALVATAAASLSASPCVAQTLSLGQAAQYGIFEVSGSSGHLSLTNDVIGGNVALGYKTTDSLTNSTITGSVTNLASGAQANTDAINAAATAAGLAHTGTISGNQIIGSTTFTGQAGQNVVNLTNIILTNGTFTISGNSSETFVFNVSGSIILTNSSIVLANGVTANHVIFNVTSPSTGAVTLTTSNVNGTFLALNDAITVTNGSSDGAFISEKAITITNDPYRASPLAASAPEMPTIMMAGLGCLVLLGSVGLRELKRKRSFGTVSALE
jgi:choice-of-anchor A domain-containing protein